MVRSPPPSAVNGVALQVEAGRANGHEFMNYSPLTRRRPLLRYGIAVLASVVATLLRMAVDPLVGDYAVPFITYFVAVVFVAASYGFWAATLTILLSALAAAYYFLAPEGLRCRAEDATDSQGLAEQAFGRCGIAQRREHEVDGGARGIDGPIEVVPTSGPSREDRSHRHARICWSA